MRTKLSSLNGRLNHIPSMFLFISFSPENEPLAFPYPNFNPNLVDSQILPSPNSCQSCEPLSVSADILEPLYLADLSITSMAVFSALLQTIFRSRTLVKVLSLVFHPDVDLTHFGILAVSLQQWLGIAKAVASMTMNKF